MAELVDAHGSGPCGDYSMRVRVSPSPPILNFRNLLFIKKIIIKIMNLRKKRKSSIRVYRSESEQTKVQENRRGPNKLKIIILGGAEEVGRNMTIFEYKNDIVILDMGLQFPEEDMPGIDYIIPNISYLRGREKNIKAVIFSHGHLDHIGAAPILLEKLGYPLVVARNLTIAMIKHRLEDYKKGSSKYLKTINVKTLRDKFRFGYFNIGFFNIEHSIIDAIGVILRVPEGTVIHLSDWTMERDAKGKLILDYSRLAKLPRPTILMLESLGAVDVRKSATSDEMKKNLTELIKNASGRVIIGTFSSQVERINWIFEISTKLGRKVALDGYSMKVNVELARKFGYIKINKSNSINVGQIDNYPDNKVLILCTGSQGEGSAVLTRIIEREHRYIKLRRNDTVVLSSSIIPGNERTIQRLKDNLYRQCDNVIHGNIMDVHVSGHGNKEDIITMLKTVKPNYFIPTCANHYMLKEAAKLARGIGIEEKNILVPDNGLVIEISRAGAYLTSKKVPSDYVFVDGLGVGDVSNVVIRDRQVLSADGMLVVIVTIARKTGQLIGSPDIISRGFVYMKGSKTLIEQTRNKVKKILRDKNPKTEANEMYIKNKIRDDIGQFLFSKTQRRPMVLPVLIEV